MDSLFGSCLAGKHRSKQTITGSTVLKFVKNPFVVWCDLFAPASERDVESPFQHLLFERGIEHEKKVVSELYSTAEHLSFDSLEDGFRLALEYCEKGVSCLTNVPFFFLKDDIYGIFDVLEKRKGKSVFGSYYYVVKEIKSAKNLKHEYVLQGAFYNFLLGKVQGFTPDKFYLINKEMKEFEFVFAEYEQELLNCIKGIKEIFAGKQVSPTAKSCGWPWESFCNKKAVEVGDVSIVSSVGGVIKKKLNDAGVFSAKQLVDFSGDIGVDLSKAKLAASAWVENRAVVLSRPKLAVSDVEFFMDFEGTDEVDTEEGVLKFDYLIGLLERKSKDVSFIPFVSESLSGEEKIFRDFVEYVRKVPDAPIYHYGSYEKTHLRDLSIKYKLAISDILVRLVDILSIVRKCIALPVLSLSLKDVSKFIGFKYRDMASAQESIVLYLQFLETKDKKLLQRILDYNEDDVRATLVVKDYLANSLDGES